MKRIASICFCVLAVAFSACDNDVVVDDEGQFQEDLSLIKAYLTENNLTATEDEETGLHYIIHAEGDGPNALLGQTLFVDYRGLLLDGTEFDSTAETPPLEFLLGRGDVVPGWEVAFQKFNKGTRATILLPSRLGYGNNPPFGSEIPRNAVLVFEVTLVDLR